MRRFGLPLGVIALITILNSCEIEVPSRYFEVNGHRSKLNVAFADDWGPSNDLRYRTWAVSFRSEEDMPGAYITFLLGSYDNVPEISEGTYEYDFLGGEGFFTNISIGYDISYDYKGYPSGNLLGDDFSQFSGYIDIDKDGSKHYFNFEIEVTYQGEIYTINGEYEGRLTIDEGVVDPETY